VSDELWASIQPLLSVIPRRTGHPGRKRLNDRKALCGILFVLHTGIAWEHLPQELDFGSPQVQAVGITPVIARRGTEHGSRLGKYRWVV